MESGGTRGNSILLRLGSSCFSVCTLSRTAVPEASDASCLPKKSFHSNLFALVNNLLDQVTIFYILIFNRRKFKKTIELLSLFSFISLTQFMITKSNVISCK